MVPFQPYFLQCYFHPTKTVIIKFCQLSFVDCCTLVPKMPKTKMMKIDESCSNTQSPLTIPPVSQDASKSKVMSLFFQDFADIRYQPGFVDKSLMIKTILNETEGILLIAPRRFGKSVNISMLKRFFEIVPDEKVKEANRKLFEKTLIEKCQETMSYHFGKYPVIFLNFRSSNSIRSFDEALQLIGKVVHKAYTNHYYLKTSGELNDSQKSIVENWCDDEKFQTLAKTKYQIETALENLAMYLFQHWKEKIFVLVDEYDNICANFILRMRKREKEKEQEEQEQIMEDIIDLCAGTLSCLAKGCEYVQRVVITGISYIMTVGISNLNNVQVFRFQEDHDFSKYYGLNYAECRALLKKVGHESEYDELIRYYNGYRNDILCIWSIMNCLNNNCNVGNYWKDSGTPSKLYEALRIYKIRSVIIKLLANFRSTVKNPVEICYFKKITFHHLKDLVQSLQEKDPSIEHVDVFLNMLIEQGYFAISNIKFTEESNKVEIQIPNREISLEFHEQLELFCTNVYRIDFDLLKKCGSIFNQLGLSADENERYISKLFDDLSRLFRTMKVEILNEPSFHHIVYLISIYSNYKCFSEICVERNKNRLDILILTCNNVVIILELNFADAKDKDKKNIEGVDAGLNQILKRNYLDVIHNKKCEYIPTDTKVEYFILAGLHMSLEKSISLSVLLNNKDFSKRINFPKM